MALVDTAAIAASLTTRFEDEIFSSINRATVLMQVLPKGSGTTGKNLSWNAAFGTAVGTARAEGAAVSVFNSDNKAPATLEYGNYDDSFKMTGKVLLAAAAAGNPRQLADLFQEEFMECLHRLAKGIHGDLYVGSGATNFIHGLLATAGPLSATGIYANINRATFPQWAANVLTNSGVPRALTFGLMRQARLAAYVASGEKPDLIVCDPVTHVNYGQLFKQDRRWVDTIRLRGQQIVLDGGYNMLEFDGIPVIEDVDCTAGNMLFLNTRYLSIRSIPDGAQAVIGSQRGEVRGTPEEQYGASGAITAHVNPLSRDGHNYPFQIVCYPQLQAKRCNVLTRLGDLVTSVS